MLESSLGSVFEAWASPRKTARGTVRSSAELRERSSFCSRGDREGQAEGPRGAHGSARGSSQPPRKDGALSAPRASLAFRGQSHRAAHRLTVPHAVARGPLPCFSPGPTVALMHMAPVLPTLKLLGQPWGPGVHAPGGLGHVTDPPCPLHKRGPDAITSALCRHCHRLYFLSPSSVVASAGVRPRVRLGLHFWGSLPRRS